jgi:thiamine transport system permease protein
MKRKPLLILFPAFFLLVFFYLPLILVVRNSLISDGSNFSFGNFTTLFNDSYQIHVILFTLYQSFFSVILTLLIGIPAAFIFSYYDFRFKSILKSMMMVPFILPSIIVALGFILLFGNNGFINRFLSLFNFKIQFLYSFKAILVAHAFYNFPIILKTVSEALADFNQHFIDAAKSLGANRRVIFFKVLLPGILPSIINASMLVFVYCFMSFGVVLVLGSVKYTTIEVNIFMLVHNLLKTNLGMALGAIQIILSGLFLFFSIKLNNLQSENTKLIKGEKLVPLKIKFMKIKNKPVFIIIFTYSFFLLLIVLGPLLSVLFHSIFFDKHHHFMINFGMFKQILSNKYDSILGESVLNSISNSILLGISTVFGSITLSILFGISLINMKKSNFWEMFASLPMGVSAVTLTLGYLYIVDNSIVHFSGLFLVIIAHIVLAFPFVSRIILQGLKNIDKNRIDSAKILGADNFTIFKKIIIPSLKNDIFVASTFAFGISFGEIGAVSMLQKDFTTIPIAIYRYIGTYHMQEATILGVIQIIVAILIFYFSDLKVFK